MSVPFGNSNYPTSYRLGCGRRRELGAACRELGLLRPLVVTDPGIHALPWFRALVEQLADAGIEAAVWSDVQANPSGADVEAGVTEFRAGRHDGIVAIGGGSPMDVAKCIALLADNPGDVFDYEDIGDNWKRADPTRIAKVIAVPTTAGTGSEVGRASVILDERDRAKKIIFHPRMQPALVIADPELTFDLPPGLSAATGMDALAHCFEAFCAPSYHPMADGIALEGMRLIHENLPRVLADGRDATARAHMMMAAAMGATAFQKGLGLVHALSHPLGGATHIHHGTANAIFLPYVMVYNREVIAGPMERLARTLDLDRTGDRRGAQSGFAAVLGWMLDLRERLGLPHTLQTTPGFDEHLARELAPLAVRDPSLGSNPRPASERDCELVFLKAWRGDLEPS